MIERGDLKVEKVFSKMGIAKLSDRFFQNDKEGKWVSNRHYKAI
jgi:hypothetical protein